MTVKDGPVAAEWLGRRSITKDHELNQTARGLGVSDNSRSRAQKRSAPKRWLLFAWREA
jgi:hypothetical protein